MTQVDPLKKLHFEQVVAEHRRPLMNALSKMLNHAEVEEVVQEASLKVFLHLDSIESATLKHYWFRAARNIALTRLRHEKVVQHFSYDLGTQMLDQQGHTDLTALFEKNETREILIKAINRLPPVCRNVFLYRKIDGLSKQHIAEILGVSVHTIDNHLTHGMKLCRRFVAEMMATTPEAEVPGITAEIT